MQTVEYQCLEGQPSAEVIGWITTMNQEIFSFGETAVVLSGFFSRQQNPLVCIASITGRPIGFKIGFEESPSCFESWRGGVVERERRQGVAKELMRLQHLWCKEKGYKVIKTTTNNDNVPMLVLNMQSGFLITGSFMNRRKRLKLLQEKWLASSSPV